MGLTTKRKKKEKKYKKKSEIYQPNVIAEYSNKGKYIFYKNLFYSLLQSKMKEENWKYFVENNY